MMRLIMRLSRLLLLALAIGAVAGAQPARAFSVTNGGGLNSGTAAHLTDPDEKAAHLAGPGGTNLESWGDHSMASSGSSAAAPATGAPGVTRWSDDWFGKTIIIGGSYKYPPLSP
jgi:hypothetical protein